MIISQTPFRISFFGGGTDYPDWYRLHGGSVISTTIDKYCYISCRYLPPFFEHKHRLVYSQIETINEISEIKHPAARGVLSVLKMEKGIEIHHDGDLPARAGIGSSSAFTVGLLKTLHALNGQMISKFDLAKQAINIEQNVIKEAVGSQDQVATAYGGLNRIDFFQDDTFTVTPVIMPKDRKENFENHFMLFFTGFQRNAPEVAKKKIENFKNKEKELLSMRGLVDEAVNILHSPNQPITEIGKILHESWLMKKSIAEGVSNTDIDSIYDAGKKAGALGGKLIGAGGGGFILFFVEPEKQRKVREALKNLINVSFRFENGGSKIVLYDPNF